MPRAPVKDWGSEPWHLVDDILRGIESLGTWEGIKAMGHHLVANPLIIGFIFLILKTLHTFSTKPPEIKGHHVRSITNPDEWNSLLKEAKKEKKIVVCHFYAAWSPTCKAAGKILQKMSIEYEDGNTIFARVDIAEVPSLKHTFNIESTPTFKILIAEQQIETMAGWQEAGLRGMMNRNGCKGAPKSFKKIAAEREKEKESDEQQKDKEGAVAAAAEAEAIKETKKDK